MPTAILLLALAAPSQGPGYQRAYDDAEADLVPARCGPIRRRIRLAVEFDVEVRPSVRYLPEREPLYVEAEARGRGPARDRAGIQYNDYGERIWYADNGRAYCVDRSGRSYWYDGPARGARSLPQPAVQEYRSPCGPNGCPRPR